MSEAAPQILSTVGQTVWAKRRPAWTRTDTMRWLNERSAGVLAWVRRRAPNQSPSHSQNMGRWLLDNLTNDFNRAHLKLTAAEKAKANPTLLEVLT